MILKEKEVEILNVMCNDIRIKDIGYIVNLSTSSVEKILNKLREENDINTNHGLVAQYLMDKNE